MTMKLLDRLCGNGRGYAITTYQWMDADTLCTILWLDGRMYEQYTTPLELLEGMRCHSPRN
jgi:hypothetical protein